MVLTAVAHGVYGIFDDVMFALAARSLQDFLRHGDSFKRREFPKTQIKSARRSSGHSPSRSAQSWHQHCHKDDGDEEHHDEEHHDEEGDEKPNGGEDEKKSRCLRRNRSDIL